MAKKFVFQDNGTVLDFGTAKFTVDISNPDLIDKILVFAKEATKKAKELEKEEDYVKGLREVISFSLGTIDNILGKGASDKIFKGRTVSMLDALQVLDYITTEVKREKSVAYTMYSPENLKK